MRIAAAIIFALLILFALSKTILNVMAYDKKQKEDSLNEALDKIEKALDKIENGKDK